ncbi:MAG: nucleoside-triphosphatase [Coriobacteriales bacterium]|jgi:nucleoside-triphosphatase THEP1|nr:nucleoside-triphosphatase [Coriobacteriales bacterium]
MLTILSGASGTGKTSKLLQLVDVAQSQGIQVVGVLCPAVFTGAQKSGIDALLLPSGHRRPLARRRDTAGEGEHGLCWDFEQQTMAVVNRHLHASRGDLLLIDEVGPLELLYAEGFAEAVRVLEKRLYVSALAVVRPTLVVDAKRRFGRSVVIDVAQFLPGINLLASLMDA